MLWISTQVSNVNKSAQPRLSPKPSKKTQKQQRLQLPCKVIMSSPLVILLKRRWSSPSVTNCLLCARFKTTKPPRSKTSWQLLRQLQEQYFSKINPEDFGVLAAKHEKPKSAPETSEDQKKPAKKGKKQADDGSMWDKGRVYFWTHGSRDLTFDHVTRRSTYMYSYVRVHMHLGLFW